MKGRDISHGDIIVFLGAPHRIVHLADYPLAERGGEGWRIAYDRTGWGITLTPDQEYTTA